MQLSIFTLLFAVFTGIAAQQHHTDPHTGNVQHSLHKPYSSEINQFKHSTKAPLEKPSSLYIDDYLTTLVTLTKTASKELRQNENEEVSTAYDSHFEVATSSAVASSTASASSTSSTSLSNSGTATYYSVSADNCGTSSSDSDFVCAISKKLYDSVANSESISTYCGQNINIQYKSKTITVKVVDSCESCDATHIDLSPSAFAALDSLNVGVLDITWSWA